MKIAVVGCSSFIASHIINSLDDEQIQLSLFGRKPLGKKFFFYDYPVTPIDVNLLIENDYILYLAGAGVQPNEVTPANLLYGVNAFYPIQLINELRERRYTGCLVTFGSYFEIGASHDCVPTKEELVIFSEALPLNEYATSKRILTRFLYDRFRDFSFDVMHFILPNVYGKGENEHRLLPYLVARIKENKPIRLTSGLQVRQYLHVKDIAQFIKRIILERRAAKGIFNLGSVDVMPVHQIVKITLEASKELGFKEPEVAFDTLTKQDTKASYLALDDTYARKSLMWSPGYSFRDTVQEYF